MNKKKKTFLPSFNSLRVSTPEELLVVNSVLLALALLRFKTISANVEFSAVILVSKRWMGQHPATWSNDISDRAAETVIENLTVWINTGFRCVNGPNASGLLLLVDKTWGAGHQHRQSVNAVVELVT